MIGAGNHAGPGSALIDPPVGEVCFSGDAHLYFVCMRHIQNMGGKAKPLGPLGIAASAAVKMAQMGIHDAAIQLCLG